MSTLADRLLAASGRLFVGRTTECELFSQAVKASELPFSIIHVYGPGGIGKTSLLYEFRRICRALSIPAYYLDARTIHADSVAFTEAIRSLTGARESTTTGGLLADSESRQVLLIDTFEVMGGLEQWIYNSFFASISDQVLIVVAGRSGPSPVWLNDPGWQSLIRKVPLRNLSPSDSVLYLGKSGLPDEHHELVVEYTHGHPLALSLVTDLYSQRPSVFLEPDLEPNLIKVLLDRFVKDAPSPEHATAVEACALVNHLTEPLLSEMMGQQDVRAIFEWLRSLSFIESGPRGIFPHDLARDVLGSDLKWRNPEQYKVLHQLARAYYNTRLPDATPEEQRNILSDYIYLHRDNPVVRPFFKRLQSSWQGGGSAITTHRYELEDLEQILAMVAKHEGEESAGHAQHWLKLQPENVLVYKNAAGEVRGFLLQLALQDAAQDDLRADPIALKAWNHIKEHYPLRSGEGATYFRFWMDVDGYQNISKVLSLIFVSMVRHYLTTPDLAFSLLPISRPFFWKLIFSYADLHRVKSLNYKLNRKSYGVYVHDWRSRPPAAWLDLLASREVWGNFAPEEEPEMRPLIVLSEEMFTNAVRDALKHYTRPMSLKNSPLLDSRIVSEKVEHETNIDDRVQALMELLKEGIEHLERDPRQEKAYRAVDRTYIRPAGPQEQVAELLGVPYSTFRRHLAHGVSEIVEALWQQEIRQ